MSLTKVTYSMINGASVNVLDYGAVGDGITDDTAAIQAAINAATSSGNTVVFPTATYKAGLLDVTCSIYGQNATVYGYLRVVGDDIAVKDLNIVSTNAVYGVFLAGSTVTPTFYYRQKLENVKITFDTGVATATSLGVTASNIFYLTIVNCNILYGVQLIGCPLYQITNNVLDGDNYSNQNELLHASINSVGIISNNTFINSLDNFIDLYTSGAKTVIDGNRFTGNKLRLGTAFEFKVTLTDTSNTSSDANGWEEQIIFSNNMIVGCETITAGFNSIISIFYLDSRAVPVFDWADTPRNIVIEGNVFDGLDATLAGSGYIAGIYCEKINSINISNNIFRNIGFGSTSFSDISSAIWVDNCQDVVISGNKLNVNGGTGVSLHQTCTNITIANNHMTDDLRYDYVLKYGIRITKEGSRTSPVITNSKFVGNTIVASLFGIRQIYYVGGNFSDNIISANVIAQQSEFQYLSRCLFTSNNFQCTTGKSFGLQIGSISAISSYNTIVNNQVITDSAGPAPGIINFRNRCSNISMNSITDATNGIQCIGTSTAGELDYLNIKDNFSVNQTLVNFPAYSSMDAADTATLQVVNNQKVT
jgi:hypothetical protein